MKFDLISWVLNPYVLTFFTLFTGMLFGKVKFGKLKLGLAGPLFTGLFIGWGTLKLANTIQEGSAHFGAASKFISTGLIPSTISTMFLIMFVGSVGLLASKDLGAVLKKYGFKFLSLGVTITLLGAVLCYGLTRFDVKGTPYEISGIYTAALSSSPGFAAALETAESHAQKWVENFEDLDDNSKNKILNVLDPSNELTAENTSTLTAVQKEKFIAEAAGSTGTGFAVAYPFGIIIVILAMNILPKIFNIDIEKEKKEFKQEMEELSKQTQSKKIETVKFDLASFAFACFMGYTLGQIKINLGPIGFFSLGSTGGVLIGALILGYIGKVGIFRFRMDAVVLGGIRDISLGSFAGIVGLKYGGRVIKSLTTGGLNFIVIAIVVAVLCILAGFVLGRYVYKINWIMLSGAICGGMTSTPGLGIAIDSLETNDPATGYAATYPFALIGMVLFTIILHNLPY